MYKFFHEYENLNREPFSKIIYTLLFVLSVFMIFLGVSGIIEHKSPTSLASMATLSSDFFVHIKYHVLIISGALCFTFTACFIRNDSQ